MIPLTVTAITPAGYASSGPLAPTIDGILAYAVMRERLGEDFGANMDFIPVEGLPLRRVEHGEWWWYYCGLPQNAASLGQHDKFFHLRFNSDDAEKFIAGKSKINTSAGPHKNMRKSHMVQVTPSVSWKCVGDPVEIRRLLSGIPSIGSGHTRGLGRVTEWRVTEGYDGDIVRPVPVTYAEANGLEGFRLETGLRPPAHWIGNRVECVIPRSVFG